MGTLTTKSQAKNTQAEYTGNGLFINVNYNEDAITSTLQSLNGTIYKTENMTYAGNFNGQLNGEEIEYSMSGVKSSDMPAVITALTDIETQIKAQEQPVNHDLPAGEE